MNDDIDIEELRESLKLSDSALARRVCPLLGKNLHAMNRIQSYEELAPGLRRRLKIKQGQISRAKFDDSRNRYKEMATAIENMVNWWDQNPTVHIRYVALAMDPDIAFILWFRHDTGQYLYGFETRDATKLSYQRGKEFFGGDWEPIPDPGVV